MQKQVSSPFSTGGGGPHFENQVQTLFTILMLTGGIAPCGPSFPITKIKLQGRYIGYNTDDFIVFTQDEKSDLSANLLGQIKFSARVTDGDNAFGEVTAAAWSDFNNAGLFNRDRDSFALVTGLLSGTENEARKLLDDARTCETSNEFFEKVSTPNFSSDLKRQKLHAFQVQLRLANGGKAVEPEQVWQFLKCFHLLGYDLDMKTGVVVSLLKSLIAQFTTTDPSAIFNLVAGEVALFGNHGGTLTRETISNQVTTLFSRRIQTIPSQFITDGVSLQNSSTSTYIDSLAFAALLGKWNENVSGDLEVIKTLIESND